MRSSLRFAGLALTGVAMAFACGDDHQFNGAPAKGDAGAAGADGASTSGHGGSAGSVSMNEGGESAGTSTSSLGGAPSSSGGGDDGAGGAGLLPSCADGYSDWLTSGFAFPDGDVIGTADFPSMPWVKQGSLKIDTGRLVGPGVAVVSQGSAFPYAGSRLRFRARFTDSNQEISAAFDTGSDGSGGMRVEVDGYGRLSLTEGKTTVAFVDIAPLEAGVDWFVESFFAETSATVLLSRGNYASAKQAQVVATLDTDALKGAASGTRAAIELSANGTSPAVDEIAIARCGMVPPEYQAKFIDAFERPNSANLGHADLPATAIWEKGDQNAVIQSGAMLLASLDSAWTDQGEQFPLSGLRVRAAFSTMDASSWLSVYINKPKTELAVATDLGFWLWGDPNKGVYTSVFAGDKTPEIVHSSVMFAAGAKFYAEADFDSGVAVLTLRSGGFDGPILLVDHETGLVPTVGRLLMLQTANGFDERGTFVDSISVDAYAP